jgi:L-seryl-tRNA(Ser) seleniumtransferase
MPTKVSPTNRPPAVETLLEMDGLRELIDRLGRPVVADIVRAEIASLRSHLGSEVPWPQESEILTGIQKRAGQRDRRFPQRVINATGVLLHTNLGRAPWGQYLLDQISERLTSYISLEFDVEAGKRGRRAMTVEEELAKLAGAEAALVVNNNAAAVYLVLTSLAWDREVVISRGELVQIGGGFRIPDILARSGAVLREIGTTNQTHLRDYQEACGVQTALILKVHRSNFEQTGFVAEVEPKQLAQLGHDTGVRVVWDLGSGAVGPGSVCAHSAEPTLKAAVATGVDLVTCSGDKLLGGPQSGIVLGRRDVVARLKSDPFYRALRPDKGTLLALEATVAAHRAGRADTLIPFYRMLAIPAEELRARAERLATAAGDAGWDASVVATEDTFGGGAAPGKTVAGWALRILPDAAPDQIMRTARAFTPPILGKISDNALLFSLRTMFPSDDADLERFLRDYDHDSL